MRKRISRLISALLAFALLLTAAGCSSKKPEAVSAEEEELPGNFDTRLDRSKGGVINVAGNYGSFEALEAVFADFKRYYPGAELRYTKIDDYNKNIAGALTSENPPEIFFYPAWMIKNDEHQDLANAAEDLTSIGMELGIIRDGLIMKDKEGHIPVLPVFSSTYGMLVNENIFNMLGLRVPTTYTELLSVCASLKQAGYRSPIMGFNDHNGMFFSFVYPQFCGNIKDNGDAKNKLNSLDPTAGEYMRSCLDSCRSMGRSGCVDFNYNDSVKDNYDKLIKRFLEGDVPMMLCSGDAPAGTLNRENGSDAFKARPFSYSFHPVPVNDEGMWFVNSISLCLAVNKNGKNREFANEFMRFICTEEEMNKLSAEKRLMAATKNVAPDSFYASFGAIDSEHTIYTHSFGLSEAPLNQLRWAAYDVANGKASVDDAVDKFSKY